MKTKEYHFRLMNGRNVVVDTTCSFEAIRRMGDTMATAQNTRLRVQAWNNPMHRWDCLGAFMGNRKFDNWDKEIWTINEDYKGMTRTRKEAAL